MLQIKSIDVVIGISNVVWIFDTQIEVYIIIFSNEIKTSCVFFDCSSRYVNVEYLFFYIYLYPDEFMRIYLFQYII